MKEGQTLRKVNYVTMKKRRIIVHSMAGGTCLVDFLHGEDSFTVMLDCKVLAYDDTFGMGYFLPGTLWAEGQ